MQKRKEYFDNIHDVKHCKNDNKQNIDKYVKTFRLSTYPEFAILPCYEYTKPYQCYAIINLALK